MGKAIPFEFQDVMRQELSERPERTVAMGRSPAKVLTPS